MKFQQELLILIQLLIGVVYVSIYLVDFTLDTLSILILEISKININTKIANNIMCFTFNFLFL